MFTDRVKPDKTDEYETWSTGLVRLARWQKRSRDQNQTSEHDNKRITKQKSGISRRQDHQLTKSTSNALGSLPCFSTVSGESSHSLAAPLSLWSAISNVAYASSAGTRPGLIYVGGCRHL
ncbi:MAG: hypothetical protein E2O38_06735 [Proteobacteria bacterium]|nr:MAG: hypothetical protein E2O38_06735 [Pseudomonadota bacterium]